MFLDQKPPTNWSPADGTEPVNVLGSLVKPSPSRLTVPAQRSPLTRLPPPSECCLESFCSRCSEAEVGRRSNVQSVPLRFELVVKERTS